MNSLNQLVPTLARWSEIFMHNSMRNFIRYSKESGLSMTQIGAMFRIFHRGNCAVTDVGDELGVSAAAASQMLERLVQQGLILRSEDPNDRRMKQLVLTDKGRQVLHESIQARQAWTEELCQLLTPPEQELVVSALTVLIAKAEQFEQRPELKP